MPEPKQRGLKVRADGSIWVNGVDCVAAFARLRRHVGTAADLTAAIAWCTYARLKGWSDTETLAIWARDAREQFASSEAKRKAS